jgi:hypothetical protein
MSWNLACGIVVQSGPGLQAHVMQNCRYCCRLYRFHIFLACNFLVVFVHTFFLHEVFPQIQIKFYYLLKKIMEIMQPDILSCNCV